MQRQHDEEPLYIFDGGFGKGSKPSAALLDDYRIPHMLTEDLFNLLGE